MADIDFVIGGKNDTAKAFGAVENGLDRVATAADKASEKAASSTSRIGASISSLLTLTGALVAAKAIYSGVTGAISAVAGGMDDFDAAQESVRAMSQAMELNGGAADDLVQRYTDLSDAIEAKTNIAAEEAQALMKQAAILGVNNDEIGDMTVAAIGLSEALGVSLEDGLKKARLATEGNFAAFEKILPSIKQMATDEEKLAAVMELSARGMKMKEEASQSAGGEAERMSHRLGNLMETIGAMLAPIREIAYKGIALLADALSRVLGPAVESTQELFKKWEPVILEAIEKTVNGIVAAITMAEVIFGNFGDVVGLVFNTLKLKYETYRADTEHLFVNTIPAYLTWFGDNFFNIIETAFSAVSSVITNHVLKIRDTLAALWEFVATRGQSDILGQLGEIAGRSYLQGFENSIGELPNVAARTMTDTERQLQNQIGKTSDKLAAEFTEKFNARAVKLGQQVGENLDKNVNLKLKKTAEDAAAEIEKKLGEDSKKMAAGGTDSPLQAAESRLLTRGPADRVRDTQEQVAQNTAKMVKQQEQMLIVQAEQASMLREIRDIDAAKPTLNIAAAPI